MTTNGNGRAVIEALANSRFFLDFAWAYGELTGLPITLRAVESWQLPYHGKRNENRYCSLVAQKSSACAHCLQTQQRLSELAATGPRTVTCASGLSETAVPVRVGEQLIGFLQTGQVLRKLPSPRQCERVAQLGAAWRLGVDAATLKQAYLQTRLLTPKKHEAAVRLLSVFAEHLALVSNQVLVWQQHPEPPLVSRAKEYILDHQTEDLSLSMVAKAVNTSPFYFCKMFKKSTGINFTEYVSRVRIERAKNLALNPNLRISEIAFEVGFQSLTHFNRVFKRITGASPTQYRAKLPMG